MSDEQKLVAQVTESVETQEAEVIDSAEIIPEEERELTEEEKREFLINALKQSKIKFRPVKHFQVVTTGIKITKDSLGISHVVKEKGSVTNVTTNQFGAAYKKTRRKKNKAQRDSRRANRN